MLKNFPPHPRIPFPHPPGAYKEQGRCLRPAKGRSRQQAPTPVSALATPAPTRHLCGIMKVCAAALAVLLCTAALCSQVSSVPLGADTPTACCFSYTSRQVPRKFIVNYFETSSQCSNPGVIFLTKRGREVCAHPREAWVQEYVTDLELNP
ncbi:C-C motif chemokine 3-like 1 [Desmodus rotundus]|uniref:C-C motif chemokine 3-like 1 n=1 Tax=Desmodus rotundus TaxID=9430 RepID=UPI002381803D|nr:C-C motif chemokine 3-like 1 [Desmodus rotundus]